MNRNNIVFFIGPPVFAPENRNLKKGEVGQSITLSFHIYSCPDVEEIIIENIREKPTKSTQIKHYNILNSTLLYSEFNNTVGIKGYEILIKSKVLDKDDFHVYRITAKNRLGKSSYHFKIVDIDLWFINQTELNTLVGQEGIGMEIKCSSDTVQYITALLIESNELIKAIGDNYSVSYSFKPDRTDHLTKYKCMDITHSSIVIEVQLIVRYAPAIKGLYTNKTIKCDCDGVPAIYSVYRLDQISKYGELVRSVNMSNETININTDHFPYQINGIYMCVVSNGVPSTNGKVLQTWSTHVKYEGPPVFASENRYLNTGTVGLSITLSFQIYSYPDVEEIVIENIGPKPTKSKKFKHNNLLNSTLLYSEFNNIVGVEGYEIVIESELLDIDDFQVYRITAKNRLGESNYYFAIIDNESLPLSKNKRRNFVILCSIATIIFVYLMITHVCVCVKHIKTRDQIHHNVEEDHNYHTYDEIGTISYRAVRTMRLSDTNDNQGQFRTEQHEVGISTGVNLQSTDDDSTELIIGVPDNGLQQSDTADGQVRRMHISIDDRNSSSTDLSHIQSTDIPSFENTLNCDQTNEQIHTETPSDQHSQTSIDSESETSQNVMVGSDGDGYENPYQIVLQDHQDSYQYTQITRERNTSISSVTSLQSSDGNTIELNAIFPEYVLQQRDITGVQVQNMPISKDDTNLYNTDLTLTTCTVVRIVQSIGNSNHSIKNTNKESSSDKKSQASDDSDSESSNNVMVGNVGDGYEHPYQMVLQDNPGCNPYAEIIRERDNSNSSTESD
ncbi:uncharacterized protein LOC127721926 [Mytilus californianus]|uniref:uncharacterized protein LOC127721926 n=1 Tax=Mytilus californianus TaxID=6549 RepID=UPI0022479A2E|nr:uncharacterized protein LOC127721926 [Mytilus californianus]